MQRNLLFLLGFLAAFASCIIPNHYHFRSHFAKKAATVTGNSDVSVINGFFTQNLDHFAGNVSGTFTQRYMYSQHFTLHQRTAFLFISEDAQYETSVLTDERNPIVKAAKQFGATTFALEHRFYGLSKPNFDTFNAQNLRHLNSVQAIQDILAFIKYANVKFNMDPDVRWVLWGAGLGGILAAEARKWDPVTVAGVISSSAPLRHQYDFYQFNEGVAMTLLQTGGQLCYDKVQQGFAEIRALMRTPEGRANVSAQFNLSPPLANTSLTYNDIQMFYLSIIAPFQQIVQFNNDFNISIADMCTTVDMSNWTNVQVVYQVYAYLSTTIYGSVMPLVSSYSDFVSSLGDPSANSLFIDQRMLQYQLCTEFGYFWTTNNDEKGLFGPVVPTSLFLNQCFDIFPDANLNPVAIRDLIIDYNNLYGGSIDYSGTNAVFTNGMFDPWSRLGKESTSDFSVVTYVIPLASYAADFFPGDTNNTWINQAHALYIENINLWVNGPRNPKTFVNTTDPWVRPYWSEFGSAVQLMQAKKENVEVFSKLPEDAPSKRTYPASHSKFKRVFLGRPPHGFLPEPDYEKDAGYPAGFEQGTFRQRVDHFDNTNPNFFQQKFFKNAQWAKPGGPNFLMIGGEGPESAGWVLNPNITYLTWAQKYGATVYLLEHRFYGDSVVGDNTDFSKLNSLQMLYDLAEFIRAINYKTGTNNPWITFGGSYSGAMSAWMREVFPDMVIGAVGSSGPVYTKSDFYEYLMVVENSIRTYSSSCADNIKSGFNTMQQLFLTAEGRQNLSTIFQLSPPFGDNVTDTDQHYFFSNVYGNFQGAVQYSGDNAGAYAIGHGIPDMCKIMNNASNTPLQNIVNFNEFMSVFYSGGIPYEGMNNDYQLLIDYLKNAQQYGPDDAAGLLWTYQTCTEFGYFQSSDTGNGIFGSPTPVNLFVRMCEDLFGPYYDRQTVDIYVDYTNFKYGERAHYRGTNVVMPNGNVDPWHALGLYYPLDTSVVPYLINGTAHCADMYPARDSDAPGLKVVRDLVDQNIAKWLAQATGSSVVPPVTTAASTVPVSGATGAQTSGATSTASPAPAPTTTIQTTTRSVSSASFMISIMVLIVARLF